jgi:hypothetical protein
MTDPKELLELLCKGADPRKAKSLNIIHDVCEEQKRRGSVDFSLATIGRLSAEKKGPGPGAIRNTTGESYRAIIKAHLDHAGGKKPKGKPHKADENPFDGITDPVLRARIGILLAENESLKGQLHAARFLNNKNSVVVLSDKQKNIFPLHSDRNLTQQEVSALKQSLSDENLHKHEWIIDKKGRVLNDRKEVVFRAGFSSAIQKFLS